MHTTVPRIQPIPPGEFTPEQSKLARVGTGRENLNLVRTMVNHPGVYDKFISFAEELVFNSHLSVRDREILILKTLALCGGEYEAPIHDAVAKKIGLSEDEVAAARGDGVGLPAGEQALVRAADELILHHFVADKTWAVHCRQLRHAGDGDEQFRGSAGEERRGELEALLSGCQTTSLSGRPRAGSIGDGFGFSKDQILPTPYPRESFWPRPAW